MENQIQNNVLEHAPKVVWDDIVENSKNLETPYVFQFSETVTPYTKLKDTFFSVIKKFMNKPKDFGIVKIHINGNIISDPFRFLLDNPKNANESMEAWKNRILPNKTLVVKVFPVNTLSDKLNYALEEFLRPLVASQGIPLGGISASLEFGDHDWAPDGLEEDLTQKKKFSINIGETKQTIYEWNLEKQKEIGGLVMNKGKVQNFTQYLDNYSKKYDVSKDQIAVMSSKGMYIIAHEGFYYKVKIGVSDLTKKELLQQMLFGISATAISGNARAKEDVSILPMYNPDQHDDFVQQILKDLQYSANDLNFSMRDLLKKSFKDVCYGRRSNCGFLGYIPPREYKKVSKKFGSISKDAKIKLKNKEFKIKYYSQDNKTYLFMRGQRTVVKKSKLITDMIDALNTGSLITYGELTKTSNWDLSAVKKLIQLAYQFRVITIITP